MELLGESREDCLESVQSTQFCNADEWCEAEKEKLTQSLGHQQDFDVVENLSLQEIDVFGIGEDNQLTCAPIDGCSALEDTVNCALDVENDKVIPDNLNEESDTELSQYEKANLSHLFADGKSFWNALERAMVWKVAGINPERCLSIVKMVVVQLESIELHIDAKRRHKQCRITELFSKKD